MTTQKLTARLGCRLAHHRRVSQDTMGSLSRSARPDQLLLQGSKVVHVDRCRHPSAALPTTNGRPDRQKTIPSDDATGRPHASQQSTPTIGYGNDRLQTKSADDRLLNDSLCPRRLSGQGHAGENGQ